MIQVGLFLIIFLVNMYTYEFQGPRKMNKSYLETTAEVEISSKRHTSLHDAHPELV